jgi:hypothetical protein
VKEWLEIAEAALEMAMEAIDPVVGIPRENLYTLAPSFYSKLNHINDENVIDEMAAVNKEQFERGCSHDENSKYQYKFHYVSSFLYCYVVAGKIDEKKYDRATEYLNNEMDLFEGGNDT